MTQKRGIIYERDLTEALGDMLYSSVINVDKQATEVEQAICNFVLNRTYKRYANDFVNNDLTHQNLDGWLFVKNYDIKKISPETLAKIPKTLLMKTKINDEWSVFSHPVNAEDIPPAGTKLIKSNKSKFFMFAIYKANMGETSEFATLWNQ